MLEQSVPCRIQMSIVRVFLFYVAHKFKPDSVSEQLVGWSSRSQWRAVTKEIGKNNDASLKYRFSLGFMVKILRIRIGLQITIIF